MRRFQGALTLSTLTLLITTTVPISAWAVDPNAFNSRLQESMKHTELSISSSNCEAEGNDIVLRDVTIRLQELQNSAAQTDQSSSSDKQSKEPDGNVSPAATLVFDKIDSLRFKNVTEDQDGNYYAENVSIPMLRSATPEVTFNLKDISIEKIRLASKKNTNPLFLYFPYESSTIGEIYLTHQDQTFLNVEAFNTIYLLQPDTKRVDLSGSIKSFYYEPEKSDNPEGAKWLKDLGYDKLSGSLNFHANWDSESGKYVGDRSEITIDNAGKLTLSTNIDGITEDLINNVKNLKQLQAATKQDDTTAEMLSVMGVIQQLKFGDVTIHYDDKSLTNRILDYYAKQNGVTREDFITELKATLPLIGAKIDDPEFVKNTSEQIGNFLDNPKSLTVSATPGKTIPLTVLYATGSISAAKLINLLKVKVEANK
ncbi:hypothetical protein [uncultured Bartonella sp.]|uniref:hypothetical protein n=1 Tax=uncultured Bartonella sp. TaxID=104108 RepID=UPI0025D3CEE7|nr:hypothetical protein [uncultured Bartonella sp.]